MKNNYDMYDSAFDYAFDKAAEESEELEKAKGLAIDYNPNQNVVYVQGIPCAPKSFFTFAARLSHSYLETLYASATRSGDVITSTKIVSENRLLSSHLKFYTYLDGGIRIVGEYTNEISDTIAFDKTFKNGETIIRQIYNKSEEIAKRCKL